MHFNTIFNTQDAIGTETIIFNYISYKRKLRTLDKEYKNNISCKLISVQFDVQINYKMSPIQKVNQNILMQGDGLIGKIKIKFVIGGVTFLLYYYQLTL